jgi:hypothetical protein
MTIHGWQVRELLLPILPTPLQADGTTHPLQHTAACCKSVTLAPYKLVIDSTLMPCNKGAIKCVILPYRDNWQGDTKPLEPCTAWLATCYTLLAGAGGNKTSSCPCVSFTSIADSKKQNPNIISKNMGPLACLQGYPASMCQQPGAVDNCCCGGWASSKL